MQARSFDRMTRRVSLLALGAADPDCLATLDLCCPIIGRCDFDGLFDCFEAQFGR